MSKFLTPPVWYDKNGEENQSLVNTAGIGIGGPVNIAFGLDAKSGADGNSHSCIAIGYEATATGSSAIAIGSYDSEGSDTARAIGSEAIAIGGGASAADGSIAIGNAAGADFYDSIAIGRGAVSTTGGIAIGAGASTTGNQIQLGKNDTAYTLNIGNGNGVVDGYIRGGLYVPTNEEGFNAVTYDSDIYTQIPIDGGIYIIRVQSPNRGTLCSFLFEFSAHNTTYSLPFNYYNAKDDVMQAFIKAKPHDNSGKAVLEVVNSVSNTANILRNFEISVRLISQKYGTG